jgi:predicted RNA-binding protein with PIN domain
VTIGPAATRRWIIDGNNVFGSRPDGWWNDRDAAAQRLAQSVAEWCRTHDDEVTIVFDAPVAPTTLEVAGGNLSIVESRRRGRNAADDTIAELVADLEEGETGDVGEVRVVTSDRGLRARLPGRAEVLGAGRFLSLLDA